MRLFGYLIAPVTALALSACGGAQDVVHTHPRDPFENTNRKMYAANLKIDDYVLEPAARGYLHLPSAARTAVSNHVRWTSYPSTTLNSTLQGKADNAALAMIHFLINGLTLGFADLTENDDDPRGEDFGQTMAEWSLPEGPYVMLPVFGPGTPRSHTGRFVDALTNPLGLIDAPAADVIAAAGTPLGVLSFRANSFDQINDTKYNAADSYSRVRSFYFQYRQGQLSDGDRSAESDTDSSFDDFLNEEE